MSGPRRFLFPQNQGYGGFVRPHSLQPRFPAGPSFAGPRPLGRSGQSTMATHPTPVARPSPVNNSGMWGKPLGFGESSIATRPNPTSCPHVMFIPELEATFVKDLQLVAKCGSCGVSPYIKELNVCLAPGCLFVGCAGVEEKQLGHKDQHYSQNPTHHVSMNIQTGKTFCRDCNSMVNISAKFKSKPPESVNIKMLSSMQMSQQNEMYFENIAKACLGSDEALREEALRSLREEQGIGPILPRLLAFINTAVEKVKNLEHFFFSLWMLQALQKNKFLTEFPMYGCYVCNSVGTCIMAGRIPDKCGDADHWALRDLAIEIMGDLCRGKPVLTSTIAETFFEALEDNSSIPLGTIYGAIGGLHKLAPESIQRRVIPRMKHLSQRIDKSMSLGTAGQKVAERVREMIIRTVTPVLRAMKPHPLRDDFGSLAPYFPGLLYAKERQITNYTEKREIANSCVLNKATAPLQSKSMNTASLQTKSVNTAPLQSKSANSNSALLYQTVKARLSKSVISDAPANAAGDAGASSADMKLSQANPQKDESASKRLRLEGPHMQLPKQSQQQTLFSQQESRSSTTSATNGSTSSAPIPSPSTTQPPATSGTTSATNGSTSSAPIPSPSTTQPLATSDMPTTVASTSQVYPGLECEIRVYGIGDYATERMIRTHFGKQGTVIAVFFPKKKNGTCHVLFSRKDEAQRCITNLHGKKFKQRNLQVTSAIVQHCLREDTEGYIYCQENNICLNFNTHNEGCTLLDCKRRHICMWCDELDGTEEPHPSRFNCPQKTESYTNTPVPQTSEN